MDVRGFGVPWVSSSMASSIPLSTSSWAWKKTGLGSKGVCQSIFDENSLKHSFQKLRIYDPGPRPGAPPHALYGMVSDFWGWAALVFLVFANFSSLPHFLSLLFFFSPSLHLSLLSLSLYLLCSLCLSRQPTTPTTHTHWGGATYLSLSLSLSFFLFFRFFFFFLTLWATPPTFRTHRRGEGQGHHNGANTRTRRPDAPPPTSTGGGGALTIPTGHGWGGAAGPGPYICILIRTSLRNKPQRRLIGSPSSSRILRKVIFH